MCGECDMDKYILMCGRITWEYLSAFLGMRKDLRVVHET